MISPSSSSLPTSGVSNLRSSGGASLSMLSSSRSRHAAGRTRRAHEPPGAVCDADLVLPCLGEEPLRLIHWKARDERVTSTRVARDDLPGRECRAANGIVAAHLAGSAHSPQRVALVRARDAEDRK